MGKEISIITTCSMMMVMMKKNESKSIALFSCHCEKSLSVYKIVMRANSLLECPLKLLIWDSSFHDLCLGIGNKTSSPGVHVYELLPKVGIKEHDF